MFTVEGALEGSSGPNLGEVEGEKLEIFLLMYWKV